MGRKEGAITTIWELRSCVDGVIEAVRTCEGECGGGVKESNTFCLDINMEKEAP
jgi:hypothetical protein